MQNAGQQFGQGGASSHPGATYGHTESTATTGSITSSLRQFRKKDVDKQQVSENGTTVAESHVARVAPHNHYPPRPQDCYRYPTQFPDYGLASQVKYSEISDHQPLQEQIAPSVIQKVKGKEYMEMCNVQQPHMKPAYPDHLGNQQVYGGDPNLHPHAQYLQKDPQVHPQYKPESQYYPKEAQYQQLPHQMQKYNMPPQMRKYPTENDFLSKLRRIHPTMARSIMTEHHLQESQSSYQPMDQNRMYPHQNQRYMNYTTPMQNNPYSHGYMPPQQYTNYPPSCSYTRSPQMPPRFPSTNPHERSISPRRAYAENLPIPPINYTAIPQRISPNYPQYNTPEYAQHYQHRRTGPVTPQEFYPQPCRTTQYMPHQMPQPEMTENRVAVSNDIKQYIENWADEETASEMNQMETGRMCKENLRGRDEQSTETVYMINASELQYLENGIPLITSENGIPLVTSENGQYFLKSGVTIDNSTGMVRIVEKPAQPESGEGTADRVVNLHIIDTLKPDCMLANKPNELNQKQNDTGEKSRVVIHQNTVIQSGHSTTPKQPELVAETSTKTGTSLPVLVENSVTADLSPLEKFAENIFKESKKETVDKNCSPINMEQIENGDDFSENICPLKLLEHSDETLKAEEDDTNTSDLKLKNMPIIDLSSEEIKLEDQKLDVVLENETEKVIEECSTINKEEKEHETETEKCLIDAEMMVDDITKNKDIDEENITTNYTETPTNANSVIEDETKNTVDDCNVIEEPKEETKEATSELTKEIASKEQSSETLEETPKTDVVEDKDEVLDMLDIVTKNDEKENTAEHSSAVEKSQSVIVACEAPPKENIHENAKDTVCTSKFSEEKPIRIFPDEIFSEQTVNTTTRRAKRIFSVDDIINNIGNNTNKPKPDSLLTERRRSLQITREFLEKEIDASHVFPPKPLAVLNEHLADISEEKKEEDKMDGVEEESEKVEEITTEEDNRMEQTMEEENNDNITEKSNVNKTEEENNDKIAEESNVNIKEESRGTEEIQEIEEENIITEERETIEREIEETKKDEVIKVSEVLEAPCKQKTEETISAENTNQTQVNSEDKIDEMQTINEEKPDSVEEPQKEQEENVEIDKTVCDNEIKLSILDETIVNNVVEEQEVTMNRTDSNDNTNFRDTSSETLPNLVLREPDTDMAVQNEVLYRNAIRVDENNVLLEIAGELVEISVNIINGKKVITVLPLSESTVVDFNDNYETLDSTQVHDLVKSNISDDELNLEVSQLPSADEVPAEPDIIESTSEIIIGLDISLEEEIQLDLEKPQGLCTKAAKKLYENDLQIPSITTSEDIADNSKATSYSPNDKVSSSKEQRPEKPKSEKKKSFSSSKKSSSTKKKIKQIDDDKSVVKEFRNFRKFEKEAVEQAEQEIEEEEFVPFKDLIKARKLKKMKLLQMKVDENVSADSTNRLDQEEYSELEPELKQEEFERDKDEAETKEKDTSEEKNVDIKDKTEELELETKSKDVTKTKDYQAQSKVEKPPKVEENRKRFDEEIKNAGKKKEVTENIAEKMSKKVSFGTVTYNGSKTGPDIVHLEAKSSKLEDPRVKSKTNSGILVPSVSEFLKESEGLANNKKKLSLAEYNSRKRKLTGNNDEKEAKIRHIHPEPNADVKRPTEEPLNRLKISRPKSLDDIKLFGKPKDNSFIKRKFSLEVTSSKHYFDWEETQSPKTNLNSQEDPHKRLNEFRGLINNNKSKIVVDVSDLRPPASEGSEDEILQNYKEQVDSKLSSLNLQIPRTPKPPQSILNPFSNTETVTLMQKFLKNEKLSCEEMEKIRKIISYKRLMQQLDKIKSPGVSTSPLNPSYEIRKACTEKEMKLHLKKVSGSKRLRFRNLYTDSTSETDSDFSDKRSNGDYSVVQSNSYATAGVPKLIIKRKTEMPVPVVRLERLDLKLLTTRKRKFC